MKWTAKQVACHLDGDELAQEGTEGLGILTSDRTQVLSAAERVECLHDRLLNVRSDLVGSALLSAGSWPLSASWHVPSIFSKIVPATVKNLEDRLAHTAVILLRVPFLRPPVLGEPFALAILFQSTFDWS